MKTIKGINSTQLKLIALILMIVDHIGMVFFPNNYILRGIGRLSFPIFCFLIVEGYFHTKDLRKYLIRMAVFAIISEIPFNLIISKSLINIYYQNVFFTLLIGLLMIFFIEEKPHFQSLILAIAIIIATILNCDYSSGGILIIFLFYRFRDNIKFRNIGIIGINIFIAICSVGGNMKYLQALGSLALIPISFYNGEKGKGMKYLFYLFYPLHFLVLFFIKLYLIK